MGTLLGRSLGLFAGLLLCGLTATSDAQVVLYDDFTGPRIDPTKWFAIGEVADAEETPNEETRREIASDHLLMGLTTYGSTDGDAKVSALGRQRLRILDPSGITTMQVVMAVTAPTVQGCPANPNPSASRVEMLGTFFNDGSAGPSRTGDIMAVFGKVRASTGGNRIEASIQRCKASCVKPDVLATHVFTTTWTTGANHTLRMQWDAAANLFRFTVNPGGASEEVATLPYAFSDTTPLKGPDFKELRVENAVADCSAGQKRGSITGRFDTMMLNP